MDRHGGALTPHRGLTLGGSSAAARRCCSRRPRSRSSLVFFAWPVASILGLGLAPGGSARHRRGRCEALAQPVVLQDVVFTLVAGVVRDAPDAARRAAGRLGLRALSLSRACACCVPSRRCRSCCPPWSWRRRSWRCSDRAIRSWEPIWAILLASIFYNLAVVLRLVGGLWSHLDPRLEEAARAAGRVAVGAPSAGDLAAAAPGRAVGGVDRLPLQRDLASGGAAARRAGRRRRWRWRSTARRRQLLDLRDRRRAGGRADGSVLALLLVAYARSQERLAVEQRLRPAAETARPPAHAAGATGGRDRRWRRSACISGCRWPCWSRAR